ncbi:retrovirus-related pol polyprotein from transposon TNT 1-94 [Tanacetum coccineum]
MKDVFESTESDLCETWKQNELLKDQLLEATLKHEIECCVLLSHECVDNNMQDEIEKVQRDSIEIQDGMQKWINILENDVQRCQKQSLDFELQLQHEKEKRKCESSMKNVCETSWISKMENLESENLSLELRVHATSSVRRPSNRDSSFKNSVVSNTKNSSKKVEVSDRTNKKPDVASKLRTQSLQCWKFCDGNLEVAFRSITCYVQNLKGDDLLTGDHESNLYTISIPNMVASSLVCLVSKASSKKSWLWHRRLSHLNFGTINDLTKHDLVDGLSKFKYGKDHLCSACERGKSKKASHPPKLVPSSHSKLELLHMDLCGPMRVASINGKKYILVIVDDYSRFTWVYFLHSKDETPEIIKKFIAQVQLNYDAKIHKIRTDNGTEFKNATLKAHYEKLGIMQQFSTAQTPQQNGVVERRNRTLVEAARTMLIFSRLTEFLWAEAVSTACFTQNRSIIHTRHNKTPYELLRGRKPNVEYFHVFGSLCYPTNDRDDLGKMKPKADIAESMNTPSKEDLDNLFGPMYDEYFEKKSYDMSTNFATQ